jgi:lipopolysaccharide biosynthesis protein
VTTLSRRLAGLARSLYRRLPLPEAAKSGLADLLPAGWRDQAAELSRAGWNRAIADDGGPAHALLTQRLALARGDRGPHFAAPRPDPVDAGACDVKAIAWYLPQFHPFPENDAWWGKGFTEWTNVAKATPLFVGHEQPKLPADLGFYDLRVPEVMAEQAALAKRYGLSAFCFHFYWFGGRRLMEGPLLRWLEDPAIDFPFCLCWANENWTRRWDGSENELLIGQQHSPEDDEAFLAYVARYLADPRYVRVDGKPVLVVYRPSILPDAKATTARWRVAAERFGLPGLHLVATNAFGFTDYAALGFDALAEFPPHAIVTGEINRELTFATQDYAGLVYDYGAAAAAACAGPAAPGTCYPGVMPAWDNVARRPLAGNVFHNATPALFRSWLAAAFERARATLPEGRRLVFINAWNEWAEGAYLEPDRRNGHANLYALSSVIAGAAPANPELPALAREANAAFAPHAEAAVFAHVFYPDLAPEIAAGLDGLGPADVFVTVPDSLSSTDFAQIRAAFPTAYFLPTPNRGRDIGPFLTIVREAEARFGRRWPWGLKVHTKKSPHDAAGAAWRGALLGDLMGPSGAAVRERLKLESALGLVAPRGALIPARGDAMVNNRAGLARLAGRVPGLAAQGARPFPAGSMFWFRRAALEPLIAAGLSPDDFEPEMGQIDGAFAHAVERAFGAVVEATAFRCGEV